jgi:hypothetical protein
MAVSTGSSVLRNPFANSQSTGPTFNEPGKRAPMDNNQGGGQGSNNSGNDGSITDLGENDGFNAPNQRGNNNADKKQVNSDDPMSGLDNLWDNPPIDEKNKKPEFKGYLPEIDPKKFQEQLGNIDFSRNINPDTLAAFGRGGEDAMKALPDLINSIGRQTFSMAFNASSRMTKAGLDSVEKRFMDDLIPGAISDRLTDDELSGASELARHPKYAPMYRQVKSQLTARYPKATPQQIVEATNKYLSDFANDSTKPKETTPDNTKLLKSGAGDADWEAWLKP